MSRVFSRSAANLLYGAVVLCVLVFVLLPDSLESHQTYRLPFLMVFTATTASIYGMGWGFLAAGASALLLAQWMGLQALDGVLLLLSVVLASGIGSSLRTAHRHAKALARSHQLIAETLEIFPKIDKRQALLESLPERLVSFASGGHVGIWLPQAHSFRLLACVPDIGLQEISAQGVVGRAFREGKPQYVPDVRKDSSFIATPGLTSVAELALPLFERGEVVAVLNLERARPFLSEEVDGLIRFAETVSLQLDRLADLEIRRLLSDLSIQMQKVRSLQEAAELALLLLLHGLSLEAGVVWEARGARMRALAHQGVNEPSLLEVLHNGLPYGYGLAWEVYATGKPYFTQRYAEETCGVKPLQDLGWQTFVAHPIPTAGSMRSRFVLVVGSPQERAWRRAEKELLLLFCRNLGIGFERLIERLHHEGVNRLTQELLEEPSENLYHLVLVEAIEQVPGSEAGSLLVLEDGKYRYKAAVGYDLVGLQAAPSSPADMLDWYGLGEERSRQGEPRILSAEETEIYKVSYQTAPPEIMDTAGRAREIKANLCLPIAYRGEVLAYLNLDNLHDPQAFAEDSLHAAQFFAAPLATLLHDVRIHRLLEEAALTDSLTGLPNRRAFDKVLSEELERAVRYGYPLSLAIMDLKGFKAVNDKLGHATGDLALIRVAQLLEEERRGGDHLFRWGGDEFAAIFPHTDKGEALVVAKRYAQIIESISFGQQRLGVSIGLAAYPEDGSNPDKLLVAADNRMYEAKALGIPLKT
ncbi:diguanylate cyclase [Meiothermus cerbereus]|uniref:diguanylate cyclase n=1 Tax=Meiothermus cerbereus TaxID=65552 RepID=UPI002FDA1C2D